jgi:hypothetical protein
MPKDGGLIEKAWPTMNARISRKVLRGAKEPSHRAWPRYITA